MAGKELSRRSRQEILELLKEQIQENERLKKRISELEAQLDDRKIKIDQAGTLAEAALKLSGIFEAADEAVRIYKEGLAYEEKPD